MMEHTVTKAQFGGVGIKFNRSSGKPISIADDLKAAASDCLKKCDSMLGIAMIYIGEIWMSLSTNTI